MGNGAAPKDFQFLMQFKTHMNTHYQDTHLQKSSRFWKQYQDQSEVSKESRFCEGPYPQDGRRFCV